MGSEAKRLKSGCWTCRLRRKKCEEGGPPCLTCVNRQIHCHGYGPKPEWKDKGEKERQEAIRLRIRSSRSSAASAEASKATPSTASSSPVPATEDVHLTSHAADDPPRTSAPQENSPNDYGFPMESELGFMDTANLDPIFLADQWNYFDPGLPTSGTPMDQELAMNAITESNIAPQPANSPLSVSEPGLNHKSSEREMDLVMHYIDYVSIGDQEPSRRVHGSSKGWLLSTLLRSPGFYNAALSLSAYHQHLKATARGEPGAAAYHDYQKYRLRATQIFECLQPRFLGENLICAVELARLETIGGNRERSQSYLRSALSLLDQPKIQNRACEITASSGLITPTSPSSFSSGTLVTTRQAPPPLPSETERKALSHSQALLAWMDILTCSVQRTMPAAHETYRSLLSNSSFCLCFRAVTGCESWILQTIMDVVALDTWKRDQETHRDLSIRQLVKRADEITSAIEAKVGDLGATLGLPGQPSVGVSAQNDERPGPSLTLLYAQAALVYLNFIVSGPNCGALEVRQSIDCAIASWKSVPLFNRRRLLAWPLLITATLAKGQQRDFFRNLIESCPESRTPGIHYNIWSVVTACWEEVDAQTGTERTRMRSWGYTSEENELGLLIC